MDVDVALLGGIIAALVAQSAAIVELSRRQLKARKPLLEANPSSDEHKIGDMSVTFVMREFDALRRGYDKMQETLEEILIELREHNQGG